MALDGKTGNGKGLNAEDAVVSRRKSKSRFPAGMTSKKNKSNGRFLEPGILNLGS